MIAFDVFLNRKKLARAGVGSDGRAYSHYNVGASPYLSDGQEAITVGPRFEFQPCRVPTNDDISEHFKWEDRKLKPGDVLTIKVITAERIDEPRCRVAEDPRSIERSQRRYYQHLKRKFEKPRTK